MKNNSSNDKLLTLTLRHTISAFDWHSESGGAPKVIGLRSAALAVTERTR